MNEIQILLDKLEENRHLVENVQYLKGSASGDYTYEQRNIAFKATMKIFEAIRILEHSLNK